MERVWENSDEEDQLNFDRTPNFDQSCTRSTSIETK
jgi:hypothetical protein